MNCITYVEMDMWILFRLLLARFCGIVNDKTVPVDGDDRNDHRESHTSQNQGKHVSIGKQELTRHTLDINAQTNDGFTALHYAAQDSDPAVIELLLASGAKVNLETTEAFTALYFAAMVGNEKVVDSLLNYSEDLGSRYL